MVLYCVVTPYALSRGRRTHCFSPTGSPVFQEASLLWHSRCWCWCWCWPRWFHTRSVVWVVCWSKVIFFKLLMSYECVCTFILSSILFFFYFWVQVLGLGNLLNILCPGQISVRVYIPLKSYKMICFNIHAWITAYIYKLAMTHASFFKLLVGVRG